MVKRARAWLSATGPMAFIANLRMVLIDYGVSFFWNGILTKFVLLEAEKAECCSAVLLLHQRVWAVRAAGHGCHIVEYIRKAGWSI
jgi:hypothetical protein